MVILSKIGREVPEIVEGSFAEKMLFEPGDVDEYADKMESLLIMSNEQIADIGYGLREAMLKKFDLEVTRRKLLNLFSI
ncbi:MAG: hypothetical protein QXG50_01435 [Desulfurococcaceae archaeon]